MWGFMIDNSRDVQRTFPVLAVEIDGRNADLLQEQREKTALMLDFLSKVAPLNAKCENAESYFVGLSTEPNSGSVASLQTLSEGRPAWMFDHWSCYNR
jgi:hypothetical protein